MSMQRYDAGEGKFGQKMKKVIGQSMLHVKS